MDLQQRNAELDKKIAATDLPEAVAALRRSDHTRRRQFIILAISVALDVLLTFGLVYQSHRTTQVAAQAESNKDAIIRSCETSNKARADNKQLWDFAFSLPSDQPINPQQQAQVNQFKAYVNKTFAPRDCNKLIR